MHLRHRRHLKSSKMCMYLISLHFVVTYLNCIVLMLKFSISQFIAVLYCVKTHTHTRLTALCPGLPGWAGTRKVKAIWILLEQDTVSGSGTSWTICKSAPRSRQITTSWTICKSAPRSRQITTPAPHRSVFYRPDALPAAQPTASKHWRLSCYAVLLSDYILFHFQYRSVKVFNQCSVKTPSPVLNQCSH